MNTEIILEEDFDGKTFATDRGDYWLVQEHVYYSDGKNTYGEVVAAYSISKEAIKKLAGSQNGLD